MTKKIRLAVPVTVEGGTPIGVREGGLLERLREEVTVEALPDRVPAHIAIDLSDLQIHHSFHVSDLPAFDGVEYLDDPETALYTVVVKTHVEEEVKPEAEEGEEGEEAAAEGAEEASDEASEES
jgi:large subunit ribosomal protein L25